MQSCRNRFRLTVMPGAYLAAALWLLVLPLGWCGAAVVAAGIHELFHWGSVKLCGGQVLQGILGPGGAVLEAMPMSRGRELLCALAGPLGGIVTILIFHRCPRIVVCAAIQTAWNLLPLFPLDGGRALRCGAALLLPEKAARRVCSAASAAVRGAAAALGIYGTFFAGLGLLPVLLATFLLLRTGLRKTTCKYGESRVQ